MEGPRFHRRVPAGARESRRLRTAFGLARREVADLRREVAAQARQLEVLAERVATVSKREQELRAMLLSAHDQLMRRAEKIANDLEMELQLALSRQLPSPEPRADAGPPPAEPPAPGSHASTGKEGWHLDYSLLVRHVQEVARAVLPEHSIVVVISKGDDELLKLGGERTGWHFPRDESGVYAGYYPADGFAAISHLEDLRTRGADFLLLPATAFWWLERYEDFGRHLDDSYRRIWEEGCIIYELDGSRSDPVSEKVRTALAEKTR
jgi:hypothetical protein